LINAILPFKSNSSSGIIIPPHFAIIIFCSCRVIQADGNDVLIAVSLFN
jgi:hypothetical protein